MAVVKNLVAVKGLQVAVNFGEGGSEGLPRSSNTVPRHCRSHRLATIGKKDTFLPCFLARQAHRVRE